MLIAGETIGDLVSEILEKIKAASPRTAEAKIASAHRISIIRTNPIVLRTYLICFLDFIVSLSSSV